MFYSYLNLEVVKKTLVKGKKPKNFHDQPPSPSLTKALFVFRLNRNLQKIAEGICFPLSLSAIVLAAAQAFPALGVCPVAAWGTERVFGERGRCRVPGVLPPPPLPRARSALPGALDGNPGAANCRCMCCAGWGEWGCPGQQINPRPGPRRQLATRGGEELLPPGLAASGGARDALSPPGKSQWYLAPLASPCCASPGMQGCCWGHPPGLGGSSRARSFLNKKEANPRIPVSASCWD